MVMGLSVYMLCRIMEFFYFIFIDLKSFYYKKSERRKKILFIFYFFLFRSSLYII